MDPLNCLIICILFLFTTNQQLLGDILNLIASLEGTFCIICWLLKNKKWSIELFDYTFIEVTISIADLIML